MTLNFCTHVCASKKIWGCSDRSICLENKKSWFPCSWTPWIIHQPLLTPLHFTEEEKTLRLLYTTIKIHKINKIKTLQSRKLKLFPMGSSSKSAKKWNTIHKLPRRVGGEKRVYSPPPCFSFKTPVRDPLSIFLRSPTSLIRMGAPKNSWA